MVFRSISFIVILFATFFSSFAQEPQSIIKSTRIETEEGVEYYVHTVEKGQTLYAISKAYDVSDEEITKVNPEAKDGLRIGQELWIPLVKKEIKVERKTEDEGDFVYHIVKKGETFYSISKIYCIDIDKIKEANPDMISGPNEGAYLKIPLSFDFPDKIEVKTDTTTNQFATPAITPAITPATATATATLGNAISHTDTIDYVIHKVKKGETIYSIAQDYLLSVEDIYALNPGSEISIKKNQKIKIPLVPIAKPVAIEADTPEADFKKPSEDENIPVDQLTFCDSLMTDDEYHIAVMVPFYLDEVDSIKVHDEAEIMPPHLYKSFRFLPFYQGLLLAVDSLKRNGLNAKLHVFDATSDTFRINSILENPEMKELDLIIGLMYSNSFKVVSRFAMANGIKVVNPISNRSEIIEDNPFVFKAMASLDRQIEELTEFIIEKYHDENIIIVYNNNDEQKKNLAKIEQGFINCAQTKDIECNYKSLAWDHVNVRNIKNSLSDEKSNILITLSNDQAFVIDYLRQLNTVIDSFDLVVFGLPSWKKFTSLETKYLLNLKLHMFSNSFIDYSDDDVKVFIDEFRLRYENEPNEFAFHGFDIGYYFLSALRKFGEYFDTCIKSYRVNSLQTEYFFIREGSNGYENSYLNIYKYEDYKLLDARKIYEPVEETTEE